VFKRCLKDIFATS